MESQFLQKKKKKWHVVGPFIYRWLLFWYFIFLSLKLPSVHFMAYLLRPHWSKKFPAGNCCGCLFAACCHSVRAYTYKYTYIWHACIYLRRWYTFILEPLKTLLCKENKMLLTHHYANYALLGNFTYTYTFTFLFVFHIKGHSNHACLAIIFYGR